MKKKIFNNILQTNEGVCSMPPQSMPLQHKDYFELKATKKKQIKEKLSTPLLPPPERAGQYLN